MNIESFIQSLEEESLLSPGACLLHQDKRLARSFSQIDEVDAGVAGYGDERELSGVEVRQRPQVAHWGLVALAHVRHRGSWPG